MSLPLRPSVYERVYVNEGQATDPLYLDQFDLVMVNEGQYDTLLISGVFDEVFAEDSPAVVPITIVPAVQPFVFDPVNVDEGQADATGPEISVPEDIITVEDSGTIAMMPLYNLFVFDPVTVLDHAAPLPLAGLAIENAFDLVTVEEARFLTVTININCHDDVQLNDGGITFPPIFSIVAVEDAVELHITRLFIRGVFDEIVATDDRTAILKHLIIAVQEDPITVTDDNPAVIVRTSGTINADVHDDVTLDDSAPTVLVKPLFVSGHSDVLVEETRFVVNITRLLMDVHDDITVEEDRTVVEPFLLIERNESVSVSEERTAVVSRLLIDKHDLITVEGVGVVRDLNFTIRDVFDDVLVFDERTVLLPILTHDVVSDQVTVLDERTVSLTSINLSIPVHDEVTITEERIVTPKPLFINEFTEVFIDDSRALFLPILMLAVGDEVTVSDEVVNMALRPMFIEVYDAVMVLERRAVRFGLTGQRGRLPVFGAGD